MKISIIELVKKIPRFSGYLLQMIFIILFQYFIKTEKNIKMHGLFVRGEQKQGIMGTGCLNI